MRARHRRRSVGDCRSAGTAFRVEDGRTFRTDTLETEQCLEGLQTPAPYDDDRIDLAAAAQSTEFSAYPLFHERVSRNQGRLKKDNHRGSCKEAARGAVEIRNLRRRH